MFKDLRVCHAGQRGGHGDRYRHRRGLRDHCQSFVDDVLMPPIAREPLLLLRKRPWWTSNQAELEAVKGVGPATAKKIIANRPYMYLDELSKAGLSARKIKSFKSSHCRGAVVPATPAAAKETGKIGEAAPKAVDPYPARLWT